MTKREMFAAIRERVLDNDEMVEFIDHEVDLLARKRTSTKPTKTQRENEVSKEQRVIKDIVGKVSYFMLAPEE